MTVSQLKAELADRGIEFPNKMLKADLVKTLVESDSSASRVIVDDADINVKSEAVPILADPGSSSGSGASSSSTGPKLALLTDDDEEEEDEELPLVSSTTSTMNIDTTTKGEDRDEIAATIDEKESKDANAEKQQISGTKSDIEEGTKIIDGLFIDDDDESIDEEDDGVRVVIGSRAREKNTTKRKSFVRGLMIIFIHTIHFVFFNRLVLNSFLLIT